MIKVDTYTAKGTKGTQTSLPKEYEEKVNKTLLAQAVRVYEFMSHTGSSVTKTRGDVAASTRKIYRQKGTGRARHGALSAPIFVGGGKAHGSKKERRVLTLSRNQKQKSLAVALSLKAKEGKLVIVSDIAKVTKTKDAATLLSKVGEAKRFTVALSEKNKDAARVFRNIEKVTVTPFVSLNAYLVYRGGTIVIDKDAFESSKKEVSKSSPKK